jgi:hypothetical protein
VKENHIHNNHCHAATGSRDHRRRRERRIESPLNKEFSLLPSPFLLLISVLIAVIVAVVD